MSRLNEAVLAEKAAAIEHHLARVAERLPEDPERFEASTDAYEKPDLERIHRAARDGPGDLRAFLAALREALASASGARA